MKTTLIFPLLFSASLVGFAYPNAWTVDSQEEWEQGLALQDELEVKGGMVSPVGEKATFRSVMRSFDELRSAESIRLEQSPVWLNWKPTANIGTASMAGAPVMLSLGPDNYWMFAAYRDPSSKQGRKGAGSPPFEAKSATVEGFEVPLLTTPLANEFTAPGGLQKNAGGYHAWQSRDMVNWVHHGSVTGKDRNWVTSAEHVDGKTYIYSDFPNDQDPHLVIDSDLTDGLPGEDMGMAFKDPSHGSDSAIIRGLDGRFHLILEDWSPIDASTHAWDSPLAMHAVSEDGIRDFQILAPPVDERTKPTGTFAEYPHPHWHRDDPENYPGKPAPAVVSQHRIKEGQVVAWGEYEVHEPEQNAYGDWAAIAIGEQQYLFCDFDPVGGHGKEAMSVGWFTAGSIDGPFEWCGNIGQGHPDPDIIFAEGRFYLVTQTAKDFASPGPWVDTVEVRVGVDTNQDARIDQWTEWREVKEGYDYIPGFAKQIRKAPAAMDLTGLPKGYGFQYEVRLTDTTANKSKPMLDKIVLSFSDGAVR
ncbi:hypothetical protein AAFN60_06210 [Roseibacillus persicicus]|uniref:hypothetical protein n=1 Tax=Roseibacillus persicicus TaxID=454148 RepID=UPI00398B7710